MSYPTKIATCCYCGTRAALVLDRTRHELTCVQCGAPLHNLKMLRTDHHARESVAHKPHPVMGQQPVKLKKPRKIKRKKAFGFKNLIEEVFDVVEDIFD
ncbi:MULTISPECIES: hypothetical protein [Roseobacteraceae]|uniref:Uncharacterized protein n=1 Tax=Pseudosulfitobacter pseudonitzschiae TaxID=1402135 RepID=A0A221K1C1_9RHOB|nr:MULTISPECIES: hypothetical protein [Roseobacteraceae]ASM72785.1 hypothetical protein SULPSESMR1_01979 [Pseudosulfitobacter pseudonitzschiae]